MAAGARFDEPSSHHRRVLPPERLTDAHDLTSFSNGKHALLDDWLRQRALTSEGLSARTYVICAADSPHRVVGYYAISTAAEERTGLPSAKLRRGLPERVPLLLIGRLALDQAYQGVGLGSELLADALRRCLAAAEIVGAWGIVAHAIDDDAVGFYQLHGFLRSPLGERAMLIPMTTARALFED